MKRALITGITGQDGSYLAEFLLAKGYQVFGMVRRSSTVPFERIQHLRDRVELVHGDLLDPSSLHRAIETAKPDELYNLAAQSFVPTSWTEPVLTAEFTAVGVTRLLEALRQVNPKIRFYQASSSEMFGKVREMPQKEETPFYPRSPYGVAKVYAHWITVNYRESYGLYACSGILFNHECVTGETPVIIRRHGVVDILPIEELVPHPSESGIGKRAQMKPLDETEVWDRAGFTKVKLMSARWNEPGEDDAKVVVEVNAPHAHYRATAEHLSFLDAGGGKAKETKTEDVKPGDRLALSKPMPAPSFAGMSEEEAWLLGVVALFGEIVDRKDIRFTSDDAEFLERIATVWKRVTTGFVNVRTGGKSVISLTGAPLFEEKTANELVSANGERRVPRRILNADPTVRAAFLRGARDGEALGNGGAREEFRTFTTSSAVLAAGLWWLSQVTLEEPLRLRLAPLRGRTQYKVLLGEAPEAPNEVGKVTHSEHKGWLFDLETESKTFHAGVGDGWVHNSPRRGLEFVTRKVTDGAARIATGQAKKIRLGNLEAKRDWGFAGDYVEAMWLMLQQKEADDYVIATGETHSVQELCEIAFARAGLEWKKYVEVDPQLFRPAEVDLLIGDSGKARQKLGWKPKATFRELVEMMVDADLERARRAANAGI